MTQIYKVFLNNFSILIVDSKKKENNAVLQSINQNLLSFHSDSELISYLSSSNYLLDQDILYQSKDSLNSFNIFKSHFKYIIAAGGLVKNANNEYLMIHKNEIWDLPKGKVNNGETVEQAALREVMEETNVMELVIVSESFSTYHIYYDITLHCYVLKETEWFLMKSSSNSILIPQLEEGILDVSFQPIVGLEDLHTYKSVKLVIKYFSC